MSSEPNHKIQIDRSGRNVDTDPQGDADRSAKVTKKDTTFRAPDTGVTQVGGGDHGKIDKGVRIVRRG